MGLKETGARVTIATEDRIGVLAEVTEIIKSFGVNIISMAAMHRPDDLPESVKGEVVLRLDTKDPGQLLNELEKRGYKVTHVAQMTAVNA